MASASQEAPEGKAEAQKIDESSHAMELGGYSVAQRRKTRLRKQVRILSCMTRATTLESGWWLIKYRRPFRLFLPGSLANRRAGRASAVAMLDAVLDCRLDIAHAVPSAPWAARRGEFV